MCAWMHLCSPTSATEGAEDDIVATTGDGIPSCCVGLADCLLNRLTTTVGGTESTKYVEHWLISSVVCLSEGTLR